jgi:thioredoxin-like negative regulator of GroEL
MTTATKTFFYPDFMQWVENLVENKQTSGTNQDKQLISFTALNKKRMDRIEKTVQLNEKLLTVLQTVKPQKWVVITEAWCGDSAQILPVLAKIAEKSQGKIELTIILRDENLHIIDQYLTNGARAIPKLVIFDQTDKLLFVWGPRPQAAQQILLNWKANPSGKTWEEFEKELHTWYAQNKSQAIQDEIYGLLHEC